MSNLPSPLMPLESEPWKKMSALVPAEIARRYRVVPLEIKANTMSVAMQDADAWKVLDMLRFRTGYQIQPVTKESEVLDELLDHYYPRERTVLEDLSDELKKESEGVIRISDGSFSRVHDLKDGGSKGPVIRWVNLILEEGLRVHASDLHFESLERAFRVRIRRDGAMYELARLPKKLSDPVILRLKVMASLNTAENRLPQDGRIQVREGGRNVDLRVSTLPTMAGESVVVRILDRTTTSLQLDDLGFAQKYLVELREIFRKPHGMILVTGPTGSGKTTTLYASMREMDTKRLKVITVEDPVEYELPDLVQIPVNEAAGVTFPRILRSILRHDPDVVMIGEIRDEATAKIALQASLTGHLVISTLHTNDAPGAVTRLMEMGLEPFLIASSLKAVLAQRLVRKLCRACRTEIPSDSPSLGTLDDFELQKGTPIYEAKGCQVCQGFGYSGRSSVGELFVVTPTLRTLISEEANPETLRAEARREGMKTLIEEAREKLLQGVTSLDEYLRFRTDASKKRIRKL